MMVLSRWARIAALAGWLLCVVTLFVWFVPTVGWWLPALLVLPLLPALPGLWRGRRYTFAWLSLVSLGYMTLALTEAFATPAVRTVAFAHLLAVVWLFTSCLLFVRWQAREASATANAPAES